MNNIRKGIALSVLAAVSGFIGYGTGDYQRESQDRRETKTQLLEHNGSLQREFNCETPTPATAGPCRQLRFERDLILHPPSGGTPG